MPSPAEELFKNLSTYAEIERLIENGETEGQYLECKSPQSPQLSKGLREQLAEAISGFSNGGGGVIIWGVSTTQHGHSDLDILTQIEPIGNCRAFAKQVGKYIPLLTTPSLSTVSSTVLHSHRGDTKGLAITFIPPTLGDPVQSNIDRKFYIRISDQFALMPYEVLKRMFTGAQSPDLIPVFDNRLVKLGEDGFWEIPILMRNESSAAARDTDVSVTILNSEVCQEIKAITFRDESYLNPGRRVFTVTREAAIHRGLNLAMGSFKVAMKREKRTRRLLKLRITVYSDKMRARSWEFSVKLAKKGFDVKLLREEFLY